MTFSVAGLTGTRPGIIVDVSVAAAWCFEDEVSDLSEAALDEVARTGARVPALWTFEIADVLALAERRGRIDADRVGGFLEVLAALPIEIDAPDPHRLAPALVGIARSSELTAYDAAYLELAFRVGAPLATRDTALADAAARLGVSLFPA